MKKFFLEQHFELTCVLVNFNLNVEITGRNTTTPESSSKIWLPASRSAEIDVIGASKEISLTAVRASVLDFLYTTSINGD